MAKDNGAGHEPGRGYEPPRPLTKIRVMGKRRHGHPEIRVSTTCTKPDSSPTHDVTVATGGRRVLTGGNVLPETEVSEQYLLDLEREAS
jgi:3-hydroxyacyl-CoA dehydrogenase